MERILRLIAARGIRQVTENRTLRMFAGWPPAAEGVRNVTGPGRRRELRSAYFTR
jgi:hypothetical protein